VRRSGISILTGKVLNGTRRFKPDPKRRDFFAGMAMATPFVGAMIPYPWLFIALAAGVPFILHIAHAGIRFPQFNRIPRIIWFTALIGTVHLYGLWIGPTAYWPRTIADMTLAAAGVFVFLAGRERSKEHGEMLVGFFTVLIPFAVAVAGFGLFKAALFERGCLLGFIFERYGNLYPSGSSLKDDYNIYSLSLAVAGVGMVVNTLKGHGSAARIAFTVVGLAVVISAGVLTPSRRFPIAALFIPGLWLSAGVFLFPRSEWSRRIFIPIAVTACAVLFLCTAIRSSLPVSHYQVFSLAGSSPSPVVSQDRIYNVGTATGRLLETVRKEHSYGFASRTDRFVLAKDILVDRAWLAGIGFAYHEPFSRRFTAGSSMDYPHFPLLSEWLIGGVIGALTALTIYLSLSHTLWCLGLRGWMSGMTPIAFVVLFYSLLSGDTLFSAPQFIIACLLAQGQVETSKASDGEDRVA